MLRFAINLVISVIVILGATWLAKRQPGLAGFVAALPITTMLVLLLSHLDGVGADDQARFSRSLLLAIPLSATFLVPFVLAPRLNLGFGSAFGLGLICLGCGYAAHRAVIGHG